MCHQTFVGHLLWIVGKFCQLMFLHVLIPDCQGCWIALWQRAALVSACRSAS